MSNDLTRMKRIWSLMPHIKYWLRKWVTNLSFCYHENLFLIWELFQFDESHYLPESNLLVKEKELVCWWKVQVLFSNARKTEKKRLLAETSYNTFLIYLKAYLWTKKERNRLFHSCHSMLDISWPSRVSGAWKCSQTFNLSLGEKWCYRSNKAI